MLLTNNIFILKVGSCRHVRSNVHKRDVFCLFCCTSWKLSSKRSHSSNIHKTSRPGWKLKFADLWRLLCFIPLTFPFCALRLHGWSACITIDSRNLSLNNSWINILHLKFESAAASQFPLGTPEHPSFSLLSAACYSYTPVFTSLTYLVFPPTSLAAPHSIISHSAYKPTCFPSLRCLWSLFSHPESHPFMGV